MEIFFLLAGLLGSLAAVQQTSNSRDGSAPSEHSSPLWQKDNLVAWCIVPFDAARRGPTERAAMLADLGIRRLAYDYRGEHIPTFDAEIEALEAQGIELTAWWFPSELNDEAKLILDCLRRHGIQTQLWVTGGGGPTSSPEEQAARVAAEGERIRKIAEAAQEIGCVVGLYNHGGWFGEPENQRAIIESLDLPNVGIVYNLHHGHDHIDRFPELLDQIRPFLICLNLNGMTFEGDRRGAKILPIGAGEYDLALLQAIESSGYRGPIGILNHTDLDARARLEDNLAGLQYLNSLLIESPQPPPTALQTWQTPFPEPLQGSAVGDKTPLAMASIGHAAVRHGTASEGLATFASAKFACAACHKIGGVGGEVGPALDAIGRQRRPWSLVESIVDPQRKVDPHYQTKRLLTSDGKILTGYLHEESADGVTLRDPSTAALVTIAREEIESLADGGSVMPSGLAEGMRGQQLEDVIAFLSDLGIGAAIPPSTLPTALAQHTSGQTARFELRPAPLDPENWTTLDQPVNRDRFYQFYIKQALHFREATFPPPLLESFPGLDGGGYGHWGNQNEEGWRDERWNQTLLSSVQNGIFRGDAITVPRGICVQLDPEGEWATCFNPDTLSYDAVWNGGFLQFSPVRHGFMDGVLMAGKRIPDATTPAVSEPHQFLGYYRLGREIVFAYRIRDIEYLDSPSIKDGKLVVIRAPRSEHPLANRLGTTPPQWPETISTPIRFGKQRPYAVDTIEIPRDNPWNALIFCSGHDFLPGGDAVVCTMQGDVWRVSGLDSGSATAPVTEGVAQWRRIAAGLHQPLGLLVVDGVIHVMCRDRLMRLIDLNDDGEIDFYQSLCDRFETSPSGHDYICGLRRDANGFFYTASGNQGILKIAPDGSSVEVIASGFRNPDGLGIYPDGVVTVPCSEGEWTPASMICAVPPAGTSQLASTSQADGASPVTVPHYGYRGPRDGQPPSLPMVYLPRGVDNSSGDQTYIDSDRWGPLSGNMVHLSFGAGTQMLLLRDQVGGQLQGGIVPLPGDFFSGVHRGNFRAADGQFYASGMAGWGSYTSDDGCFQRVRYTGEPVQLPIAFHLHENGVWLRFSAPLDHQTTAEAKNHFAQLWNYRYSSAYGSPEYSTLHRGVRGHDRLRIRSAHVGQDRATLFLEIPDLQPANQLHLLVAVAPGVDRELFLTVHALDAPFTEFPGYRPDTKTIYPHPILADLAMAIDAVPNPFRGKIEGARSQVVRTASNLSYETREFHARTGEAIALTLANPDVVPHNWVLLRPGTEQQVGHLASLLVSDPAGAAQHYVPRSDDVLVYTDVVEPGQEGTIYFHAPSEPGRYTYMCTFPGHWMVMQGTLVVDKPQ